MKLPRYEVYEFQHLHECLMAIPQKAHDFRANRVILEIPQKRMVLFSNEGGTHEGNTNEDEITLLDFIKERPILHVPFEHSLLRTIRDVCDSLQEGEFPFAIVCGCLEWFASTRFPEPTSLFGIPLVLDPQMSEQTVMVVVSNVPFLLKGIHRSVVFSIPIDSSTVDIPNTDEDELDEDTDNIPEDTPEDTPEQ